MIREAPTTPMLSAIGMALALGMLVGLQRQWSDNHIAGIRSFPLITAFGALCGGLAPDYGTWLVGLGLLLVAAILGLADVSLIARGKNLGGITTELAAVVMFFVGVMLAQQRHVPAIVVSGATLVLLQAKKPLHDLAARIEEGELRAVTRLALVALVVLPILPDQAYGPYGVVNPRQVWTMVVLIVGISLAGYVAQRVLGPRGGTVVAGLLGGVVSSTATTVAEARRTRELPDEAPQSATLVMLASTVVFGRLLVEVAVAAPRMFADVGPPLGAMLAWMLVPTALALVLARRRVAPPRGPEDPTDLKGAIVFGLLYAGVLVASEATAERFGSSGLYVVAAISGLTDVDAITLSTVHLANAGRIPVSEAWRIVLVAALSNVVFKGAAIAALGSRALLRRIALLFGLVLAGGVGLVLLAP